MIKAKKGTGGRRLRKKHSLSTEMVSEGGGVFSLPSLLVGRAREHIAFKHGISCASAGLAVTPLNLRDACAVVSGELCTPHKCSRAMLSIKKVCVRSGVIIYS